MHDISIPDEDMPTARRLRYGIRRARFAAQDSHFYSEPAAGMTPCLEVSLLRHDATTWTGKPVTLWRTEAVVQLYAGVHRVNLAESRSFTHEDKARKHFGLLCTMRSQICDPPDDGWVNPAPWWPVKPVPVGTATAWCQQRQAGDLSDLFWLHALGLFVMFRCRDDGTYVHLEADDLDRRYGPLLVEVNNSGTTEYELHHDHDDDDDTDDQDGDKEDGNQPDERTQWLHAAQHSPPVDVTELANILEAQGIATSMFGSGAVEVLRIGDLRLDTHGGEVAELGAGPASWDDDAGRYLANRVDFGVGPDPEPDDPALFWYPPADAGESQIADYIMVRLAHTRSAATPPAVAAGEQP